MFTLKVNTYLIGSVVKSWSSLFQARHFGNVSFGQTCFDFVRDGNVHDDCEKLGGRLAIFNSVDKWNVVTTYLASWPDNHWIVGMRQVDPSLPWMYQKLLVWDDGTIAYYINTTRGSDTPFNLQHACRMVNGEGIVTDVSCLQTLADNFHFICEFKHNCTHPWSQNDTEEISPSVQHERNGQATTIKIGRSVESAFRSDVIRCPGLHFTFRFLACDVRAHCWAQRFGACTVPVAPLPPMFTCETRIQDVPYALVCDHRQDCSDGSDENFCVYPACDDFGHARCKRKECILQQQICDGKVDCVQEDDERGCERSMKRLEIQPTSGPAVVDFDGKGAIVVSALNLTDMVNRTGQSPCPEHSFQCPAFLHYCFPIYLRCNGVKDCPGREDEADCDNYACPGFYRCRASRMCLHPSHLCDGWVQCPLHDDEMTCPFLPCPQLCVCFGQAWLCTRRQVTAITADVRFLDAEGTGTKLSDMANATMLVFLRLARCGVMNLNTVLKMSNLRILDLSDNALMFIDWDSLAMLTNLQVLSLAKNPLVLSSTYTVNRSLLSLTVLDISQSFIPYLDTEDLSPAGNLQILNLSNCKVDAMSKSFQYLKQLRTLDLRGCPLHHFPQNVFLGLNDLGSVYTENYRLCCSKALPEGFHLAKCHAPSGELSSCDDLLRLSVYRFVLFIFASLSVTGNFCSLIYRVVYGAGSRKQAYNVFVMHLCMADSLMGVYLTFIGVADMYYHNIYWWKDLAWKTSAVCTTAGFLSMLSSEVSAFIICLITLDRFLVLQFPFSRLRFRSVSACVACCVAWAGGLSLAAIPLLPVTSHWMFYSQTGICLPLPVKRTDFPGHNYSFLVMIVLNFVLFVLIAVGQASIYWSVSSNRMSAIHTNSNSFKDMTIARRLIIVAVSDFLCWFPIGLLGLLSRHGADFPDEVNVAMAIIVLPLNSAINPFIYTLNILMQQRQRVKERQLLDKIKAQIISENIVQKVRVVSTLSEAVVLVKSWLRLGILSPDKIQRILETQEE